MSSPNDSFNLLSCKICYDNYDENDKKPELIVPCGHTFCKECLGKLIKPECPTCKKIFSNTVTVWDLIPSQQASAEPETAGLDDELAAFKNLLDYIEVLKVKESEVNNEKIKNAEMMINSKAEEIINRVIDEQNALLHRVKICKNSLDNRTIRNKMIEDFVKSRFELLSLQANYNKQLCPANKCNEETLRAEIKHEMTELGYLKENIESYIKSNDSIFNGKTLSNSEPLLGIVDVANERDKILPASVCPPVPVQEKQPVQSVVNSHSSKLNPDAVPFIQQPTIQPQPLQYNLQREPMSPTSRPVQYVIPLNPILVNQNQSAVYPTISGQSNNLAGLVNPYASPANLAPSTNGSFHPQPYNFTPYGFK